jgi:uridine phosphorylase
VTDVSQADRPMTGSRQYHIALERGELAEYILLVGDPGRVAKVAAHFDAVEVERSNREITTATGTYRGMRLSAMSTGMGPDNVEIVLAEVMEITDQPSFIRIGSSGALQPEIELGDLIVSIGAVRLENTTDFYVHPGYPAIAHREVVAALEAACLQHG